MVQTVAIVSLSSGIIGEDFARHEYEIGKKRLENYGLQVRLMEHTLKGIEYVKNHPAERAMDLICAFADPSIDMILCAIGGDDTYRLLPYLFAQNELQEAVKSGKEKKIFLGFSDTTMNHLMLHKLGIPTFYGQSFLADVCELDHEMLPYSRKYFEELLHTGRISEIRPSDVWYEERTDYSEAAVGTKRISHPDKGFELLQGQAVFSGEILGGCIDSLYDIFNHDRYADSQELCEKYHLFPEQEDWRGKILLLESSEEQPTPQLYQKMLQALKNTGIFEVLSGVLVGKPMDELYYDAYKEILIDTIADPHLSILYNVNIGHAAPRCIIPFGVRAAVDAVNQVIRFVPSC